jgi:gamma-glutamyl:cysteine ligase YbdK (ATP-grasp superfamily)
MGQEIENAHFHATDFAVYSQRLKEETDLLAHWFTDGAFDDGLPVAGFELEAWLVDEHLRPKPINDAFLKAMDNPLVSPELARFNVEFNVDPVELQGDALSRLERELNAIWQEGRQTAQTLEARLAMIGILPTVQDADLTMANLSSMNRYTALNAEILRLRGGRPLRLDIHGKDKLQAQHMDVMLESATTSFQIHLQVPQELAARAYNASIIASGPVMAVSANSPYFFGKDLWDETRIPLFEQSVEVGGFEDDAHGPMRRVTFGSGYVRHSLMECFSENLAHFPVLLPTLFDEPTEHMAHLRLHNGTLWRWNRPLIGFHNGKPHLRIEHRVVPAGPTVVDLVANAAFYYGLTHYLLTQPEAPEQQLGFAQARDNFYAAAQYSLDSHMVWLDGQKRPAKHLLAKVMLPRAKEGLLGLGLAQNEVDYYLGIIEQRIANACHGAAWQRAYVAKHGADMAGLLDAYLQRQENGRPVHEWDI